MATRRPKKPLVPAPEKPVLRPDSPSVTIIGIGASAGGLEALEEFFATVPPACGLAFVVVQHLDPTRKGLLVELLQRATPMPVVQIKDRMKIAGDRVYVIPPNRDVSVLHGTLHLLEPVAARGLRLPIDFFFRALAEDQQAHSIGVVLSGMGSDGTLGLRAIKEKAGLVFVQTPASAKFDSMPRSVVDAGLADVVAPAADLPGKILATLRHGALRTVRAGLDATDADQSGLEKVVLLLRNQTGHDFSLYKKSTLYRRIERRMSLHQLGKLADYIRYLRENPQETDLLFRELLIGVTNFFRDPAVWEQLKAKVIPDLLAAHPAGGALRAWVTGCSTGEEAYSLAMVFREALDAVKPAAHYSLQIFATDLDKDAIDKARQGAFPANIAADVSAARLRRFFAADEHGYRVAKEIREMVVFAPQNVVMDPPFTGLDLLTCRNLLIYLEADLQKQLLPLFHYSLNPGGILVLGSAETIGQASDLFTPLPGKTRIYRRPHSALKSEPVEFPAMARQRPDPAVAAAPTKPIAGNLQTLADGLLLQLYAPSAVLTTEKGDILYVSGKTGKYLEPAAGKANLNVFAMARTGLSGALNEAFAQALRDKKAHTQKGVRVGSDSGGTSVVDVTIQPLAEPAALRGLVLVVFAQVAAPAPLAAPDNSKGTRSGRLAQLAQELQQSRAEIQATRAEMQVTLEELKSTNEELQSTNEELQSTNEELTTSKEEMQSMNEELQTVNHELQAKVEELSLASDDMKNLLNSTEIAALFLDEELRVRRFTTQTASIIKLIPGDTGRPITDLVSELDYPDLADDARQVLRTLVFKVRQVSALHGRWFSVRIMPYRTQDNRIAGVVITFTDVTSAKTLESGVRATLAVVENRPASAATAGGAAATLAKAQSLLERSLQNLPEDLRRDGAAASVRTGY
jgi:two-component system CheB/CheR fusion protein